MSEAKFLAKLLDGAEVAWLPLGDVFHISAGGDKPKDTFSDVETKEFKVPILSNGIGEKSLYGWTDKPKIIEPSLTVSARGTIGWTSYRDKPFFPIIRLIVLTPKIQVNIKYAYYFMKTIENNYKVPPAGIPQLTKPMVENVNFPIPCPDNPKKSLAIQAEIVRVLDTFTELTAELTARKKQYRYYRDQLLDFTTPPAGGRHPSTGGEFPFLAKLLDGAKVAWLPLGDVFHISAGGDKPKDTFSDVETKEFKVPILSNGIGEKSLYGWTDKPKIIEPSLTVSARGTIGWTSYRDKPFFPIIRLIVLTPKIQVNIKYAYYFMKTIENNYKVPPAGIPQLTKPMVENVNFPIPCPDNPKKSLAIQAEIVRILDKFDTLIHSISEGLPREIALRQKQYHYYRDLLLNFPKPNNSPPVEGWTRSGRGGPTVTKP